MVETRMPDRHPRRRTVLFMTLIAVALVALGQTPASAQSLNAARAAGQVGERFDGIAVVRGNAPGAVRGLVDKVNAQRRQIYAKRAAEQKVPAAQVGRLYAKQIAGKAPAGTWFLLENGQWKRK